ncbi:hypothetical protein KI387_033851, partial [Taxus chinensis]
PKRKNQRGSLLLYPVFVGGPLGIVTIFELLILVFFLGLLIWSLSFYLANGLAGFNQLKLPAELKLCQLKCYIVGDRLGLVSALFLDFMLFPITRGSVLLQLLNTSFEISVRYEALILISGGSGIAPMISILSETLYKHSIKKPNHAPSEILVIWSIKGTEELCILNLVSPRMICPKYANVLKIEVHAYVTKEETPDDEIAQLDLEVMTSPTEACFSDYHINEVKSLEAKTSVACVCSITSRDNSLWQAAIVASALLGYLIFMAILNRFSVYPSDHNSCSVYA